MTASSAPRGDYRKRAIPDLFPGGLCLDLGGDHTDTVFVAGSGRSGTTWLSDLINHSNDYRYIFEPFHPEKVGLCRDFHRKQYLAPDDGREPYLHAASRVLSGRLRSRWSDRFNRRLLARRRLVKDIRANLMIGWLIQNFPRMPVVLLLRHPCAVTDSRLRLGWRDNLFETLSQRRLVEDHLKDYEREALAASDDFERSVFLWCIENYVPLRQAEDQKPGSLHVVLYERLLEEPESELSGLFGFLGRDVGEVGKLAREIRDLSRGERRSLAWRDRLPEDRTERAGEILTLFGLDSVYDADAAPKPEGVPKPSKPGS